MTVLSAVQNATTVMGLEVPSVVYGSTSREHIELARLANEMALRIAQEHDWQKLSKIATHSGNGTTVDFTPPSDFLRFEDDGELWSTQYSTNLAKVRTLDDWIEKEITNVESALGEWIYYGSQIHVRPAPGSGVTLKYAYQRNTIVRKADSSLATVFTADTDSFELDEKLLELGIIWQWKANKGQAYAEDMQNFEARKASLVKQDSGQSLLRIGKRRFSNDVRLAYPRTITP